MTALQGVWSKALEEYRELQANSTGSKDPEHLFCLGYVFGAAFGLALSTVRPDLVRTFEPKFRERGWLGEDTQYKWN